MNRTSLIKTMLALMSPAAAGLSQPVDPWTPADSVAVRYVVQDQTRPEVLGYRAAQNGIVFSPDGKYFFFVTHYGDLTSDSNVYELRVFDTECFSWRMPLVDADFTIAPTPAASAEFRTFSSRQPAIKNVHWDRDSSFVLFLGMTSEGTVQVFRLNVDSGALDQLTHQSNDIEQFAFRNDGMVAAYVSRSDDSGVSAYKHFTSVHGEALRELAGDYVGLGWISPDGRKSVMIRRSDRGIGDFVVVDLARGSVEPIVDAVGMPLSPATNHEHLSLPWDAMWSTDSAHVVLVNTTLPGVETRDAPADERVGFIVDYDTERRRWQILEPVLSRFSINGSTSGTTKASSVSWLSDGSALKIQHELNGVTVGDTIYAYVAGRWSAHSESVPVTEATSMETVGFSVRVQQSANVPPNVVASINERELSLLPPDPALQGVWIAPALAFHWQAPDGTTQTGGLLLPREFRFGQPVPLVIQVSRYDPELFLPDGPYPAPEAAQSLAANGIAVAQINSPGFVAIGQEAAFVGRIDSVVEELARAGIVDPARVGVIGFSRTGYQVLHAVTHSGKTHFTAAVCADSFTGSYPDYLAGVPGKLWSTVDDYWSAEGIWLEKGKWLENQATFNMDRVHTPLLFIEHGNGTHRHSVEALKTIGAFVLNQKPFEYLFLPEAKHGLQRPSERVALMNAVVDWMRFWLQARPEFPSQRNTL